MVHKKKVHEKRKEYVCGHCGKKFVRKPNLLLHQKTVHEGRKDFACDKCEKKFSQKGNLLSHHRTIMHATSAGRNSEVNQICRGTK
ncbi:unnamed protein product [Trichogramma brassicae]|uniref:C2H2-type domain-containing protein n=1 Tax=Trichogramma brassicae TaxID=86971 RepID=A0A6H5J0G0_9HYME|nr:unnamed protein product [Trichogramma brassicae]